MNVYHKDEEKNLEQIEKFCNSLLPEQVQYLVWEFDKAPQILKEYCDRNGGDEDWLVLVRDNCQQDPQYQGCGPDDWMPSWLERTDSCQDPDCYLINGIIIYVGSHA